MQPLLLPAPEDLRRTVRNRLSSIGLEQFYEQKIRTIEDIIGDGVAALKQMKRNWSEPHETPGLVEPDFLFRSDATLWNYALHNSSYNSLHFMTDWLLELYAIKENYAFLQPHYIQFNNKVIEATQLVLAEEHKLPEALLDDIERIHSLALEKKEYITYMRCKQGCIELFLEIVLWFCLLGLLLGAHLQYVCHQPELRCRTPQTYYYAASCVALWTLLLGNLRGSALWNSPAHALFHLCLTICCIPATIFLAMPLLQDALLADN